MNPNLQRILMAANKAVFSPLDIPDMHLWLDASDDSTLWADTAGTTPATTTVARWDDKSGNGYNPTQSSGSIRPVTNSRTINGINSLDFNGTNSRLNLPSSLYSVTNMSNSTLIVVAANDAPAATGFDQPFLLGGPGGSRYGCSFQGSGNQVFSRADAGGSSSSLTISPDTNAHVFGLIKNTTVHNVLYDGSLGTNGTANNFSNTDSGYIGIGAGGTNDPWNGPIAEILLYSRTLLAGELNKLGSYLEGKWAISWTDI